MWQPFGPCDAEYCSFTILFLNFVHGLVFQAEYISEVRETSWPLDKRKFTETVLSASSDGRTSGFPSPSEKVERSLLNWI
jgi:hypothetical protein